MKRFQEVVFRRTTTGLFAVEGATATVYDAGTTDLVTIYDDDSVTPISNPVSTDVNGTFWFYVPDGLYDILVEHSSITTYTLEDVHIVDDLTGDTADSTHNATTLLTSIRLKTPTTPPASPAAGDIWEASDLLTHGVNESVVADIAREQTFSESQIITATATAGKVGLIVKGNATAAADIVDIYDSAATPAKQSWFDSTGLLGTNLNLTFKSGTAFTATLDHAITGSHTYTLPDAAGTVALTTAPGTTGTDVAWSAAGQLLVPDASASARGVVTTGAQTLAGAKTYTGNAIYGSSNTITIGDVTLSRSAADVLQLATGDSFLPQTDGQDLGSSTKQWSLFTDLVTIGADVVLSRSAADTLQLATGDKFIPQTDSQDLGTTTQQWSLFTDLITVGADVVLTRSAADTLRLATGDSFIPQTGGQALGDASNRWALSATSGDLSTTLNVAGATTLSTVLYKDLTEVVVAANTIAAAESGSVFFLDSGTEFDSELPAPAAGLHFTFIVRAAPSGADYTISTNAAATIIVGSIHSSDGVAADTEASGTATIHFVSAAAVKGDLVELWCDGTNWYATCFCAVSTGIVFT